MSDAPTPDAPPSVPPNPPSTRIRNFVIAGVVAVIAVVAGLYFYGKANDPCGRAALQKYNEAVGEVAQRFDDANALANQTPRMSLAPQIAAIQDVRRDTQAIKPPPCAAHAHEELVAAMDSVIDGYTAFLSQKSDSVVSGYFDDYDRHFNAWQSELTELMLKVN